MKTDALKALVRPAVTILMASAVVAGFFLHLLSAEQFMSIALLVISFWFTSRQADKKQGG